MRISRFWMVGAAVLFLAGIASANPADVNFGIKDPSCLPTSCTLITSTTFSFTMPSIPPGSTANLLFENGTNVTLTSLNFDLFTGLNVSPSLFTCSIDAFFNSCNVTQVTSTISGDNEFHVLLSNVGVTGPCTPDGDHDADDLCGGILPGNTFDLQFTNPPGGNNASFDWAGAGTTVTVTTVPTPEPASLVLLASGLLPLWTLRKKFRD
ncbi:MAG TPA: PEP-CTERM sorting domain-containing protein [Candidatus Acidoferrales bacterium]|nr:PEP-CTERM sorting domain-containing protein [Candidatus Acidoferrales bacterium]